MIGGNLVYVKYDWDPAYGVESNWVTPKVFGLNTTFDGEITNNFEKLRSVGDKNAEAVASGAFNGTGTVNWTMSNPWWCKMFWGIAVDAGAAPVTHTWTEANWTAADIIFTVGRGYNLTAGGAGANVNTSSISCVAQSITLSANQGESVTMSASLAWVTEATDAVIGAAATDVGYGAPFIFAHGSLSVGGGPIAEIESLSLEINQNVAHQVFIGNRLAQGLFSGARDYNFTIGVAMEDDTYLDWVYGQAGSPLTSDNVAAAGANIVLTFTNGLAGVNERSLVMTFANFYLESRSESLNPEDLVKEELSGYALSLTSAVASDNTAIAR